jgi:hypothetical protein
MRVSLAFGLAMMLEISAAWAQTSPLPGPVALPPVTADTAAPQCTMAADACQVCAPKPDGTRVCSTPGIACNAGVLQCTPASNQKSDSPPPAPSK